ncbi:alpha-L-fucosidase [Paenibacillus sp. sptzw28]|uniref:alpha-L-fucosidase n=1 Tax=Paenibacillus sp. sptzw28 TaxID=715179 RepID=UPI002163D74D|nr:alpha-L-fucosidase [Paenibacillus sp. sptzw28]
MVKAQIAKGPFEPAFESLRNFKCPDWFRDAKLGIWSHWGAQSVPMYGDWYARNMYYEGSEQYRYHIRHYGHPSTFGYKDIVQLWKAEKFDPESLMDLYVAAAPSISLRKLCTTTTSSTMIRKSTAMKIEFLVIF